MDGKLKDVASNITLAERWRRAGRRQRKADPVKFMRRLRFLENHVVAMYVNKEK